MFATKLDGPDFARHLVAAAAAYISVLLRGRVRLQLNDGTMLVTLLEGSMFIKEMDEESNMEI